MTTEATQNPQAPQPPVMDVAEVYLILGRLEQAQAGTKDQLVDIKAQIVRQEERNDQNFRDGNGRIDRLEENGNRQFAELNRRIDRLWYTIVGIGAALAVGLILQSVLGS